MRITQYSTMINDKLAGIPKNKFTPEEDEKLRQLVAKYGTKDWKVIARKLEKRTPRQCRERYNNYAGPSFTNSKWTEDEDKLLDEKYQQYGSKWQTIAKFFPNRSGNNIRNRYKLRQKQALKEISQHTSSATPPPQEEEPPAINLFYPNDPFQIQNQQQLFLDAIKDFFSLDSLTSNQKEEIFS